MRLTVHARILKALLGLDKVPRLRTAQITGFRRGMGDSGANVVVYDGSNFGELRAEDMLSGVVFFASSSVDEEKLIRYTGHTGDLRATEIRVSCSSLSGNTDKTKTIVGRVFMEEGEGENRIYTRRASIPQRSFGGSMAVEELSQAGDISGEEDWEEEAKVARGRKEVGHNQAGYEGGSDATLIAVENSTHLRSLSASFVHKNEVSLGFFKVSGASDTAVVESSAEDEVETQAPDNMSGDTEDVYKAFCAQQINSHTNVLANTGAVEEADDAKDIDLGTDIAPAESILSAGMSNEANISKNDQEDISTPKEKSWAPTIPWRKELATSPVRPTMTLPQAPSASTVKFRKAGGAIRNLVDMFEGLSSKSTPEKSS
ncbi:hypothetical protein Ptr902_11355 [Pyrenophora tritici-repentis]|nr:hypothetical protein Ptr902_11355 [Pyrenophora tritici-repentis]